MAASALIMGAVVPSLSAKEITAPADGSPVVMDMPIEDLMKISVTSVSKRPEPWFQAASAIYVLTGEEIRRSGATTIPEALRLVPGLQVARVDAHTWAISARGFNSMFSDKLLVLMDGRALYTPLFAGVFWDVQDTFIEDIDRIEVIRGPGATMWGANAVNGVINIITKKASDTQGGIVYGAAGTEERGAAGFRFGGKVSDQAYYRVYGKWFTRDDAVFSDGSDAADDWYQGRGGFRVDWTPSDDNLLTLQGDLYGSKEGQTYFSDPEDPSTRIDDRVQASGGNLLARLTHHLANDSELTVQSYYDRTFRELVQFNETRDTFDIEMDHRFALGERNRITWGLGYRLTCNELDDTPTIQWDVNDRNLQLFSAFVQDHIILVPDRLSLTLGSKFEHNDFTGYEIQPSARAAWTPTARQTVWGAISRAVRTPSQSDRDMRFDVDSAFFPGVALEFLGNDNFDSEELLAYELGYRVQPVEKVTLDIATFYNVYQNLRSLENRGFFLTPPPPYIGVQVDNLLDAHTYGIECAGTWQATHWWRWQVAYTYLRMDVDPATGSTDSAREEGDVPRHQVSLRSMMDLPGKFEFDTTLRFVDILPTQGVPSYLVMDVRLGWSPNPNLEVAVVGQNLLDNAHPEFSSLFTIQRTEVEHSVYGKVTYRF